MADFDGGAELRNARKNAGLTQWELASKVGTTQSQIMKLENGTRALKAEWAGRLGAALNIDPLTLLPPEQRVALRPAAPEPARGPVRVPDGDMPIHSFLWDGRIDDEPAGSAPVPAYLSGVKGAYGLLVAGDDMAPRYRPGQLLHINPRRAPTLGSGVVARLADGRALLREWGGVDGLHVVLSSYVAGEETVDRSDIEAVHVVVGSQEAA